MNEEILFEEMEEVEEITESVEIPQPTVEEYEPSPFKLTMDQVVLSHVFNQMKNAVGAGKRALTPHDKFVRLEVTEENGQAYLSVRATAGGDFKEMRVQAKSGTPGVLPLLEFNHINSILQTIDVSAEVELYEDPSKTRQVLMTYTNRQTPIRFATAPSMNFPHIPDYANPNVTLSLAVDELEKCVNVMSSYIGETASNPILACILVKLEQGKIMVTGIDDKAKRFAYLELPATTSSEGEFLVEVNKLKRVLSGFDDNYDVHVAVTQGHVTFYQQNLVISLNTIAGQLPNIIPFTHKPHKVALTFNKSEMLSALERAKVFVDESNFASRVVSVSFDNGFSSMKINSTIGLLNETVITQMTGAPFTMNFLVDSFHQTIKSIDDDNVAMIFSSTSGGVVMPATGSQSYQDQRVLVQAVRTI